MRRPITMRQSAIIFFRRQVFLRQWEEKNDICTCRTVIFHEIETYRVGMGERDIEDEKVFAPRIARRSTQWQWMVW